MHERAHYLLCYYGVQEINTHEKDFNPITTMETTVSELSHASSNKSTQPKPTEDTIWGHSTLHQSKPMSTASSTWPRPDKSRPMDMDITTRTTRNPSPNCIRIQTSRRHIQPSIHGVFSTRVLFQPNCDTYKAPQPTHRIFRRFK